jgi:ADP-heptose:LPS heptosyltransferase
MNWLGAIKSESVLDRIKSFQYDAMVDLNQSNEQTLSLLSMELDIPIKIGFQSPLADKLYTLVIQRSSTGFLEKNYETIERILGLK